jgi:hypothetical protein
MTQTEKDEKIQQLERELREFKATPLEPQRWRAELGIAYEFIDDDGEAKIACEDRYPLDDIRHALGNYWKPNSKDAENCTLYFVAHSKWEYWMPESDMAKPKAVPEGLQYLDAGHGCWLSSEWEPCRWWLSLYRWPKTSYKGE